LIEPIYKSLGINNIQDEPYLDRLARNIAVKWACYVGVDECIQSTTGRIKEFIALDKTFDIDLQSVGFCAGMRHTEQDTFNDFLTKMLRSTDQVERNFMIAAMGCAQNSSLLNEFLTTSIAQTGVTYSNSERLRVVTAVSEGGIVGVRAIMNFLELYATQASQL
jgi:aminopeptidase N